MNEFILGILATFVLLLTLIGGFTMGANTMADNCDTFGKFKRFGKVYECKEAKNE